MEDFEMTWSYAWHYCVILFKDYSYLIETITHVRPCTIYVCILYIYSAFQKNDLQASFAPPFGHFLTFSIFYYYFELTHFRESFLSATLKKVSTPLLSFYYLLTSLSNQCSKQVASKSMSAELESL